MERAPLPSLAAAAALALAEMDELLMDTPLSAVAEVEAPRRPRQDEPPSQVGTGATTPRALHRANEAPET
eukprot:scaffold102779_cov40-Tisochrysis_lutea.AAC.1